MADAAWPDDDGADPEDVSLDPAEEAISCGVTALVEGSGSQLLRITLDPNQQLVAEAGSLVYMDPGVGFELRMGDGTPPKEPEAFFSRLTPGFRRFLTNENLFFTLFTNNEEVPRSLALAAPFSGAIKLLDLTRYQNTIIVQADAFLAASGGTKLSLERTVNTAGVCGGEGLILLRVEATRGGFFAMHGGGQVVQRSLASSELLVDATMVLAYTDGIQLSVESTDVKRGCVAGEGQVMIALSGTGAIWLQSEAFARCARELRPNGKKRTGPDFDDSEAIRDFTAVLH